MSTKTVPLKETVINDCTYTISPHPGFPQGAKCAFKVNELIQPHVLKAQEDIARSLSKEDQEKIKNNPDQAEKIIANALGLADMIAMRRNMLSKMRAEDMIPLAADLFEFTNSAQNGMLDNDMARGQEFMTNYKNIVPLMNEVIEYNGFLDLDVGELMG